MNGSSVHAKQDKNVVSNGLKHVSNGSRNHHSREIENKNSRNIENYHKNGRRGRRGKNKAMIFNKFN